jgi:hypothetical protein
MSFSVEELHAESEAPKSPARVRAPDDEALVNTRLPDDRLLDDRLDTVVVAREEVPDTESVPPTTTLPDAVIAVAEAFVSVVFPVTSRVDEKLPVVPVIAPREATVE